MFNLKKAQKCLLAALALWLAAGIIFFPAPLQAGEKIGEELFFTILYTNDEHSAVIPHSPAVDFNPRMDNPALGGFARLATAVKEIRAAKGQSGEPVILTSGGDFIGGTPYSWLATQDLAAELTLMQLIGYDAVTIGNHEYDYGAENLAAYLKAAGYPSAHEQTAVLATNTTAPDCHPMADGLYRDTHLLKLDNGVTLGLLGLIGEEAENVAYSYDPLVFEDRHQSAERAVAELQQQGADVIVALTHSGVGEDIALAEAVPGIHVIAGGHCHSALHEPVLANGTIIVQAGSRLEYLGVLELAYNPYTQELRLRNEENSQPFLVKLDNRFPLDSDIEAAIGLYTEELNKFVSEHTMGQFEGIMDIVASSQFSLSNQPPLRESGLGNFIADAMRLVTWEKTGQKVDFALQANGSIRGSVFPGNMQYSQNQISFYDLAVPVSLGIGEDGYAGYSIASIYLTGEEVYRLLEVAVLLKEMMGDAFFLQFSGLRYAYNPRNAVLFTIPFIDQPLPTALLPGSLGAVVRAERWTGDGIQCLDNGNYVPIERSQDSLYHIATDNYILSFLPMVGDMLPMLEIIPKDEQGNPLPLDNPDKFIVNIEGRDLKIWQAVAEYAASQPTHEAGTAAIDDYYRETAARINRVWAFPIIAWPLMLVAALIAAIVLLVRHIRRRRRAL